MADKLQEDETPRPLSVPPAGDGVMAAVIPGRATAALRRAWEINKPLTIGASMVMLLLLTSAGMVVDSRLVTRAPVWAKPSKFALSVAIYAFTFLWMLSLVR